MTTSNSTTTHLQVVDRVLWRIIFVRSFVHLVAPVVRDRALERLQQHPLPKTRH